MRSLLFLASFCLSTHDLLALDWTLRSEGNGLKVYSREEPGSPVLSFRAEATVEASPDRIQKLLANPSDYKRWMPLVRDSRVLDDRSALEKVVYVQIGMPWPVKDRYFINHGFAKTLPDGSRLLEIKSIPYDYADSSKIAGWTTRSFFAIRPLQETDRSYMEIELNQDPKGSIPKWMVNWAQVQWPKLFFKNLKTYLEDPSASLN